MRWIVGLAILMIACASWAESLITAAKVLEISERGFVLMVGTEPLAVEDAPDTKFWMKNQGTKRDAVQKGDQVTVRVKVDNDPPVLREMADESTWKWLESIRKTARKATVEKVDSKLLYVRFDDGTKFAYRHTDKSDFKLNGKSNASIADLAAGATIYVKGRLLPSLDTWADEISDTPPVEKPTKTTSKGTKTTKKAKPVKLPASGKLEGILLADMPPLKMFDILVEEIHTYHISYNLETKYYLDRKAADRGALIKQAHCLVTYKRDKFGRLLATKVEVFTRT